MIKRSILAILILLFGCTNITQDNVENVYFEIPHNWKKIKVKSTDSYTLGYIIPNIKDTVFIEFGKNTGFGNEENYVVNDHMFYQHIKKQNPESPLQLALDTIYDYQQGLFLKNYYYYDTIDGKLAKVMLPKKEKEGSIGIYFKQIDAKKNNFSIYADTPLSKETRDDLMKVFYSIKFK